MEKFSRSPVAVKSQSDAEWVAEGGNLESNVFMNDFIITFPEMPRFHLKPIWKNLYFSNKIKD